MLEFEFALQIELEIELEFQKPNDPLRERDQHINFGKETKASTLGKRPNHQLWETDQTINFGKVTKASISTLGNIPNHLRSVQRKLS